MGSWSGLVNESSASVYQKASAVVQANDMVVVSTMPTRSLTAEAKLGLPLKPKDKIIVNISGEGEEKCSVNVTTYGSKADAALNQLVGVLRLL